jgi:hypothetical protein
MFTSPLKDSDNLTFVQTNLLRRPSSGLLLLCNKQTLYKIAYIFPFALPLPCVHWELCKIVGFQENTRRFSSSILIIKIMSSSRPIRRRHNIVFSNRLVIETRKMKLCLVLLLLVISMPSILFTAEATAAAASECSNFINRKHNLHRRSTCHQAYNSNSASDQFGRRRLRLALFNNNDNRNYNSQESLLASILQDARGGAFAARHIARKATTRRIETFK